MYAQILIDLFKFLAPFLRNADLNRAMQVLYKVRPFQSFPNSLLPLKFIFFYTRSHSMLIA